MCVAIERENLMTDVVFNEAQGPERMIPHVNSHFKEKTIMKLASTTCKAPLPKIMIS